MAASCVTARPLSMKYLAVRWRVVSSMGKFMLAPESCVEVAIGSTPAVVDPLVLSEVLVDSKRGANRPAGEMRYNDGDMAGGGDHRVGAVGVALSRATRMGVDVGHNHQIFRSAQ